MTKQELQDKFDEIINDIVERLGCDESDIDIEYDVEPETE